MLTELCTWQLTFNPEAHGEFGDMEARMTKQTDRTGKDCMHNCLQQCGMYGVMLTARRLSKKVARSIVLFRSSIPCTRDRGVDNQGNALGKRKIYWFDVTIYSAICANMVFLAMDKPGLDPEADLARAVRAADKAFMVIFTLEFLLKVCTAHLLPSAHTLCD